jgi:hypothetical protein
LSYLLSYLLSYFEGWDGRESYFEGFEEEEGLGPAPPFCGMLSAREGHAPGTETWGLTASGSANLEMSC